MNCKHAAVRHQLDSDVIKGAAQFWLLRMEPSGNKVLDIQHLWIVKYLCILRYLTLDVHNFEDKIHSLIKDLKDYIEAHFRFEQRLTDYLGRLSLFDSKSDKNKFVLIFNRLEHAINSRSRVKDKDTDLFVQSLEDWIASHSVRTHDEFFEEFSKNSAKLTNLIKQMVKQKELVLTSQEYQLYLEVVKLPK